MSFVIHLEQPTGTRQVDDDEFPLAIGGPNAAISLHGVRSVEPIAWLGLSGVELFVQPAETAEAEAEAVLCNGAPVGTSQWLHDGDVLRVANATLVIATGADEARIRVEPVEDDQVTEPPVIVAGASAPDTEEATTVSAVEFKPRDVAKATRKRGPIRIAAGVFWVTMLGLAAVVWFVLTASPLEIVVEPTPDFEELEGTLPTFKIAERYLLRPGTYTLTAGKEGYQVLETRIEVSGSSDETLSFTLAKLPGFLIVDAGKWVGAEVLVDDALVGETPLEPIELSAGEHRVRVVAERYLDFNATVEIEGRGSTDTLTVEMIPGWATVTFRSNPPGASVRVAGREVGTTPVTSDLGPGRHAYEVRLRGYKPRGGTVSVAADEARTVSVGTLELLDGRLRIASDPSGATVTVNGEYRGPAPVEVEVPPGRDYEIEASKAGFEPESRQVRSVSGETVELDIALSPVLGEVDIVVSPADAQLFVDGELQEESSAVLRLNAVPHAIEVRKDGFLPYQGSVTPRIGFPQTIEVTLETEEQLKARTTPSVIRSPQGQKLVLIEGGQVRMGASRREPGRRANETIRNVELTRQFYFSTTEVTNREFHEFLKKHFSGRVGDFNLEIEDHPVVRVSWEDAARYCNWLSQQEGLPPAYVDRGGRIVGTRPLGTGYRLPTEAEWSWVARYAEGGEPLKYPWGNSLPVIDNSGNYADEDAEGLLPNSLDGYEDPFPATAPVETFKPNAWGVFNMGGNVAEWVHDYYTIYPSDSGSVETDPAGPEDGELHVIRGGSWMDSSVAELRLTFRDYGGNPRPDVGFRIARYAE